LRLGRRDFEPPGRRPSACLDSRCLLSRRRRSSSGSRSLLDRSATEESEFRLVRMLRLLGLGGSANMSSIPVGLPAALNRSSSPRDLVGRCPGGGGGLPIGLGGTFSGLGRAGGCLGGCEVGSLSLRVSLDY
jgi:hypothetical protein